MVKKGKGKGQRIAMQHLSNVYILCTYGSIAIAREECCVLLSFLGTVYSSVPECVSCKVLQVKDAVKVHVCKLHERDQALQEPMHQVLHES